jgi:hypothetical protein
MPRDAYTTPAYHHDRTAKSRSAATDQSNSGAQAAREENALPALGHPTKSDEASKLAYEKSVLRPASVPAGVK